jgi:hypothetical protein
MVLFGHHTQGFLEIDIMGQPFPTGPMEHGIAFAATGIALILILYGAYAGVRDFRYWLRRRAGA